MATEGDKFEISTMSAAIHGSTKSRVPAVDHFFFVFDLSRTSTKGIFDFLKMITKYFLQNIHVIIMKESDTKNKPQTPHE